jgi:hypothetical protein
MVRLVMLGLCYGEGIMRKSLLAAGGAVALGLGLAVPAVSASASGTAAGPPSGTAANPLRIDIITKATAINNFVDTGPAD